MQLTPIGTPQHLKKVGSLLLPVNAGVVLDSSAGGTGNAFTKISGPTTAEKTKTVRDANDTILELGGSYTPSGTWIWTTASVTWPTFNQNTSGVAAGLAAQYIDWTAGSGGASIANKPTLGTIASQAASAVAITGGTLAGLTGLGIRDTSAAFDVTIACTSSTALNAGRILTIDMKNAANSLNFTAASAITFPSGTKTLLAADGSIAGLTGTIASAVLGASTVYIGTTAVALNRASANLALTGITATLAAGTATAGTAPLKFTTGVVLTTPEAGAMEFVTDTLSFTITTGAARKTIAFTDSSMAPTAINPFTTAAESWIGASATAGIYFKGGNFGLGATNPLGILHTITNANTDGAHYFDNYRDNTGAVSFYTRFARGTLASPAVVQSGDNIFQLRGRGYSAAAGAFVDAAAIQMIVDGVPDSAGDATDMPGRIVFLTTPDGSGSLVEAMRISNNKIVQMSAYGVGTATFDASGNISSVSDERLKIIQGKYMAGLKELLGIQPINYKWNKESGMEMEHSYAGFSAQNIQKVMPDAVYKNSEGYLSFNDRAISAATVNAVKEIDVRVITLEDKVKEQQSQIKALQAILN